ncbi:hypothetical protein H5410_003533 [Solanum commersonii]|uniref:Trichome birefringence-like N-terminal domain-containing protein n=1 Tax=Solanum commersonii TaxID=4109 RepID=A0A9J6B5A8_SOLCO|nr:hypothetical protein H5410_003533 [Solanum commersonii]
MVEFGENETKKEAWWEVMSHCDVFDGRWVKDDANPMYEPGSCPFIDESFDCYQNGRPDNGYVGINAWFVCSKILLKTRIEFLKYLEERLSRKRDWWMRREYEVKDVSVVDDASALPEAKEMMDLNIENNDVNEDKDHEQ